MRRFGAETLEIGPALNIHVNIAQCPTYGPEPLLDPQEKVDSIAREYHDGEQELGRSADNRLLTKRHTLHMIPTPPLALA